MRGLLILAALVLGGCQGDGSSAPPLPTPDTLGWADGAYVATVHGKELPFWIAGESVGVGSVDLQSTWQHPSFSFRNWWYVGGRNTASGPFQLALYPSIRAAKVYARGQWHDAKVSFVKGNG